MSFAHEDEFNAFVYRDGALPSLTAEAVGEALLDYPILSDRTLGWIALAVRRALAATIPSSSDGSQRMSNRDIRKELMALSKAVGSVWVKVSDLSQAADSRLWDHAFRDWEGINALATSDDPEFDHNRIRRAVAHMDWLSGYLRDAARSTEAQRGDWRRAEERRLRVERGQFLAPVFEAAFRQAVTANNWPSDSRHEVPTPFMDFYQRMVALAFNEKATPDLSGILKLACRMHRDCPVVFPEEMIPGLGGALTDAIKT